jgi:hypothetical protein
VLPRTPTTQVVLVGITCFATVGMFSAVSNLGAGGTQDVSLSDTANGVLYGMFALTGLISGGINNRACAPHTPLRAPVSLTSARQSWARD